jgi:hypothetical protein
LRIGDDANAHELLQRIMDSNPNSPDLLVQLGKVQFRRRQLNDAEASFTRALELDADKATAYEGLAQVYSRRHRYEDAADAALSAVGILHHLPRSHFLLGRALARLGLHHRAVQALEIAVHIRPEMKNAHRLLAAIYGTALHDEDRRQQHWAQYQQLCRAPGDHQGASSARADVRRGLPDIPPLEERRRLLDTHRPHGAAPAEPAGTSGKTFVLVSGLPRSGTSLMMQMLNKGGLPAMTDGERAADIDNPEGYLEWEAIKQVGRQPELFDDDELQGRSIKVISMLLPRLPPQHRYKVVFMTRPLSEIAGSQKRMIDRLGTQGMDQPLEQVAEQLADHSRQILAWIGRQENFECCMVHYPSLVANPDKVIARVVKFLGPERLPNHDRMAEVVRPDLYRQRSGGE